MRCQLGEALANKVGVVEKALRTANQIHRVEMHCELRTLDSPQQTQVVVRRVGINPGHRLQSVERAPRLHRVYDFSHGINNEVERFRCEISRVWPVPLLASGTGNVDTAASANTLGQSQAFLTLFQRLMALFCRFAER